MEENRNTINWFPGHMAKTRRLIEENLKLVDICIEIVDARLILSSKSPLVDELISSKPRLLVINKADLADENVNKLWETYFKENKINAVFVNSRDGGKLLNLISGKINQILADRLIFCLPLPVPEPAPHIQDRRLVRQKVKR